MDRFGGLVIYDRELVLRRKLDQLLRVAAEVSFALERVDGTWEETPHSTTIELRAHGLGRRLAREVQERWMGELAAGSEPTASCPGCGMRCPTKPRKRRVQSIDGPVELIEPACQCPVCRRSFFPRRTKLGFDARS